MVVEDKIFSNRGTLLNCPPNLGYCENTRVFLAGLIELPELLWSNSDAFLVGVWPPECMGSSIQTKKMVQRP